MGKESSLYRSNKFLILFFFILIFLGCSKDNNIDCTESLISFDWVYPNYKDTTAAFKFNSDNTFNYSSVVFKITRYGTWQQLESCNFRLTYQNGDIKDITISDDSFLIGSTEYKRY